MVTGARLSPGLSRCFPAGVRTKGVALYGPYPAIDFNGTLPRNASLLRALNVKFIGAMIGRGCVSRCYGKQREVLFFN